MGLAANLPKNGGLMDLEDVQAAEDAAKKEARREMLAIVAAGKDAAVEELEKLRMKAHEMTRRRDRSLEAANEKIRRFKLEEVSPAMRAARECEEALQALYAEFVSPKLVRARDAADERLGHARARRRAHDIAERETKRLLELAERRGKIDKRTRAEWLAKLKASAADGKRLDAELEELTKAALEAETALEDARAAARAVSS